VPEEHSIRNRATEPSTSVSLNSKKLDFDRLQFTSFFFRAVRMLDGHSLFSRKKSAAFCAKRQMRSAAKRSSVAASGLALYRDPLPRHPNRRNRWQSQNEIQRCSVCDGQNRIEPTAWRGRADHQNACGQRIERAKVANLTKAGQVADGIHDVVRCFALWLVNDKGFHQTERVCGFRRISVRAMSPKF